PREPVGVSGVRPARRARVVLRRTGRCGVRLLRRDRRRPGLGARRPVAGPAGRSGSPCGRRDEPSARGPPGGPGHAVRLHRVPPGAPDAKLRAAGPMSYLSDLDLSNLPRHVAIVMDGNGPWAKQRGPARTEAPSAGEEALFDVVDGALDIGLKWLTVYAFSTENWKRPQSEVRYLM